jgi:hypothetical protein
MNLRAKNGRIEPVFGHLARTANLGFNSNYQASGTEAANFPPQILKQRKGRCLG